MKNGKYIKRILRDFEKSGDLSKATRQLTLIINRLKIRR
jgi:hypothetical protein